MVSVVSTKNSEYNKFFLAVIESLDKYFDKTPKLVVIALPDGEIKEPHFSTFGVDSYDLMDMSALCQHEAYKELAYDACIQYIQDYFDGYDIDGEVNNEPNE